MKTAKEYLAIGSQLTASEFDKGKSVGLQNTLEYAMAEYNKDISILIDKKVEKLSIDWVKNRKTIKALWELQEELR